MLTLLVAGLGAAPVWAQTLENVVISASRAQQRSFDAPAAIESVDRETIQNAGPQVNLSETLNRVPGLTILNRQNYAQDLQISIRGFGARSAFGIRGIRLLIDGIPATTPDGQGQGSSVALTSTERIEVLRGPLALMYGNSAGGVIQAFTREAPKAPEADVQYYTGSYGMRRSVWQFGDTIGNVGLVADYSTFNSSGFRDNSATERKQFNGKLSFGPDEKTRVNLVFNHFDMPLAQDPAGLTATQLATDATQAGNNTVTRRVRKITSQNQVGTTLTHALDENRSVSARAYYGTRDNLQFQALNTWVGLNRTYYGLGLQYNEQTRIAATPVRWVVGYDFDRSREYRQGGVAALGEKTTTTRREDNQAENSDLFAQATALVSEKFSLTGGLRYSTVRMLSDDYYITPTDGNGSGNISYSAASPVLGVTWHASDALNVYANYGKGFETPTLAEMAYTSTSTLTSAFNTSLSAASSQHYEAGAKWAPDARSRVDVTVFQINTTDEIVVASSSGGISTFKNAPGTSRVGWELAARRLLTANWRAMLSASAIDAQYTQTFTSGTNTVNSGNKMPGIPQYFVFTELLWTAQAMDNARRKPLLDTQAGVEVVSAGRIYVNDTNYDTLARSATQADGYTTLNLKASHGWPVAGKGSLTAYGRLDNVTDQRYVGSVIVNQASSQFYEPAPGFNWTLGARLNVPL
ncbi:MAG: TonB-dependent receptor [Hylemonella sp.]|nr:TonB-dependent receptor [Hylemonella sp.]